MIQENILIAAAIILPGFIISRLVNLFVPTEEQAFQYKAFIYAVYTLINFSIWHNLIKAVSHLPYVPVNLEITVFSQILITFIGPIIIGLIWGVTLRKGLLQRCIRFLGFGQVSSMVPPWDRKFSSIYEEAEWLLVTLKDGEKICGYFASQSSAATAKKGRDLFIENVYEYREDEHWLPIPVNSGVYIPGDQIKHIRFYKPIRESK